MMLRVKGAIWALFMGYILAGLPASAQLKITFPVSRLVLQRDNANQATLQLVGSFSQTLDAVEACLVARSIGQGTSIDWQLLQANPANGQFQGNLIVKGGWYKVLIRGRLNGQIVASDSVDRFGVGEVFAIMGHSNAQGSACTVNGVNQCPTIAGASDDRVTVVTVDQNSTAFQQYLNTADTRYLPGLAFSQLLTYSGMSPFASIAWLWGHMGDELVKRINVPVLLYNAGFGGTNMQQTYWAAYNIPFQHTFVRYDLRMPYANLRNLMNLYVPTTGLRAVLIQHGENDRDNPRDSTAKYYYKVINQLRSEFSKPSLSCIIALSSFVGARFENVRSAQLQVIRTANYSTFQGPDLDSINTQTDRPDGIHFSPTGQVKAGNSWAWAISHTNFSDMLPYAAESQPLASLACADANNLLLTQPAGYQYTWNTGSTSRSVSVGAGTYSARLLTGQNKVYFPPAIVVPKTVQPATPTLITSTGTMTICQRTGLTLTSSYAGLNQWSTGVTAASVIVSKPGVYSVQAQDAVYGCLSAPRSQTISLASTDVSLILQPSRHVVALNDTVSFQLNVQNRSSCDMGPVTFQSRLPPNVAFISSEESLSAVTDIVRGTTPDIAAGDQLSQKFVVRLTAAGTYLATAELTASTNPIPNATLNNGTANGEMDETQTDLRTLEPAAIQYVSPNPNQRALPAVVSGQPTPDASKADLSLLLVSSSLDVRVGQPVSITLTVTNQGGRAATNVVITNSLMAGLTFVNSSSGMSLNGSTVSGTISQIEAGQSISLTFVVQAASSGSFSNQAQIITVDQADPDSNPGNGYTNGEDDQASIFLRVTT